MLKVGVWFRCHHDETRKGLHIFLGGFYFENKNENVKLPKYTAKKSVVHLLFGWAKIGGQREGKGWVRFWGYFFGSFLQRCEVPTLFRGDGKKRSRNLALLLYQYMVRGFGDFSTEMRLEKRGEEKRREAKLSTTSFYLSKVNPTQPLSPVSSGPTAPDHSPSSLAAAPYVHTDCSPLASRAT